MAKAPELASVTDRKSSRAETGATSSDTRGAIVVGSAKGGVGRQEAFMLARRASAILVALAVLSGTATAKEWTKLRLGTSADEPPSASVQADGTWWGWKSISRQTSASA